MLSGSKFVAIEPEKVRIETVQSKAARACCTALCRHKQFGEEIFKDVNVSIV
jgi:hypothetical protein